jgi:hypothetical protein
MSLFLSKMPVVAIFGFIAVFSFGCASSKSTGMTEATSQEPGPTKWSEVEMLDITQYPDLPIEFDRRVEHDVPDILLNSQADKGVVEQVEGFRIQVFSSADRNEAVKAEDRIKEWFNSLTQQRREVLGLQKDPVIYGFYKQPYYRVRIGDYLSRAEAQPIVNVLKLTFSSVLIVPDLIQVLK